MSDEYGSVARGKLKLKSDGSGDIQKKSKKKRRDKDKLKSSAEQSIREEMSESQAATGGRTDGPASSSASRRTLTKAEVAFKQMQEKTVSLLRFISSSGRVNKTLLLPAKEENPREGLSNSQATGGEVQPAPGQSYRAL